NGDPNSHEPEKGDARALFNGLAQVIVRADVGRGPLTLRASAPGLKPARVRVDRLAIPPLVEAPAVASATRIERWRMSPLLSSRPDPALAPADG
ncbi:hypothetical protein ACTGXY_11435, partial [Streptococcus suis]